MQASGAVLDAPQLGLSKAEEDGSCRQRLKEAKKQLEQAYEKVISVKMARAETAI